MRTLGVFIVITGLAWSQPAETALREANSLKTFNMTAISADGRKLAWAEEIRPRNGAIYITELPASTPRRVTAGDGQQSLRETSFDWSPDSSSICFFSDAEMRGQPNLYISDLSGGKPRRLTGLNGFASKPKWSPDGKRIAFLYVENAIREAGPLVAGTRLVGVIESKVYEQRIAIADVADGHITQISPADMYVYEFDWSPDSNQLAAIAAHGDGDNNWWVAQLYTIDAKSGQTKPIFRPEHQIAIPRWSPDGKRVAFIQGVMSDEGSIGGEIYIVPATGGAAKNITPAIRISPSSIYWKQTGRLLFTAAAGGGMAIGFVDLSTGQNELLWKGDETLKATRDAALSLSADGKTTATIRTSYTMPPEVWTGPIGSWTKVTNANAARKPLWGDAKSISWKNDNFDIQGWLLYPKPYDPSKKYPMVVSIHGGPASSKKASWPDQDDLTAMLTQHGYFVFMPNPRGSYGEGEAFTRANVKDFGHGDLRDILAGVDTVLKTANIDPNRLGVTGWSYGGYMTMWTVTQTNRFKAAVAGAGIANWKSYYGQNNIDQWMIPYFGASVYQDPAVYAKSSPIEFINNVRTPTLVIVGERDSECPAPQSFEFWHALKTLGVKTELVVYQDEGHAIMQPEHKLDRLNRTIAWFNANL